MTATEIRTRLMEMDARSEEQVHIGDWDDGAGRTGQAFGVEDPDGHDEKGVGIIVTDDDEVLVHDWHGGGVYAGIGEAERILDALDAGDPCPGCGGSKCGGDMDEAAEEVRIGEHECSHFRTCRATRRCVQCCGCQRCVWDRGR